MIKNRNDLRFYLIEVAKRFKLNYLYYRIKLIYGGEDAHILRYLKTLRYLEYCSNIHRNPMTILFFWYFRFRWMRLSLRYNLHILPNTVGYGFYMAHMAGGGIVNCKSMGNYCSINGGVVIGNNNSPSAIPVIGNNVKFSIGCKVFGNISIGNNVVVAPNAVVISNIPDNTIVGGVPAKVIKSL